MFTRTAWLAIIIGVSVLGPKLFVGCVGACILPAGLALCTPRQKLYDNRTND